jgi:nucleoside-diphosphate-sugar epimerase
MNEKIISVVTGASGFVGSHLVDRLIKEGHHVKCILRKSSSRKWLDGKPVEIIDSGLFDRDKLKTILKDADYLFHVAGVVKAKHYQDYLNGNVETTRALLETVAEVNPRIKKVIIVSSLTACGPSMNGITSTEETIEHPLTSYGKSKLEQEKLAKSFMDRLPITIIRPPAVFGPRDTEIFLVFKTYKAGLMTLIGFDKKELSLVYVEDLVNGIYLAAVSNKSNGQTYFIAAEEINNWIEVSGYLSKALGKKAINLHLPHFIVYSVAAIAQFFALFSSKAATFNIEKARDFVQNAWTCDVSKAKKELGYSQSISIEEAMIRTADWYKKEKWL